MGRDDDTRVNAFSCAVALPVPPDSIFCMANALFVFGVALRMRLAWLPRWDFSVKAMVPCVTTLSHQSGKLFILGIPLFSAAVVM